ncbi:RagB/SusD family nutrient uptake outer membrane protein [Gabonibacter chumensis]|uniref:RagB/SusD family nutrient uptake outer membrane protein n=1 Tax=Gabonibacter chumensis TaxID=2972474 RepID=UPI0025747385|nr:RagB/SusD family nutrient uptake outer membrane protein [Gabonibacter chumensis]MCR9013147.1 RagB/SusD family nutrient uptake outer membrane protein [Gabonibacter chumensis]
MKVHVLIILTGMIISFSSCNDWLNVDAQDTVTEKELFQEGDGFRTALNGVYKQMADPALYGKEMTWGFLDVLGKVYLRNGFRSHTAYYKVYNSYAYTDAVVKELIGPIWEKTYTAIANCNNIIGKIEKIEANKFQDAQAEKDLIKGEALALRAFLHFDMARLFAPAPVVNDNANYIPYYDMYPSTFSPDKPTKEILEHCVADLLQAKDLLAPYDTLTWRNMLQTKFRIEYGKGDYRINPEPFFQRRGYRMNYLAICALLARIYNYMGFYDEERLTYYAKAYEMAHHVSTFKVDTNSSSKGTLGFTEYYYASTNRKLYDGIIFGLYNKELGNDYEKVHDNTDLKFYIDKSIYTDNSDIRYEDLTIPSGSRYRVSNKYLPETGDKEDNETLIPMIRLSEMYYIEAEYLYRKGATKDAIARMDQVRDARACTIGPEGEMEKNIKDLPSFKTELIKEAQRDFMQEGQAFYFYKRYNKFPSSSMVQKGFVLDKPDSQTIF